MIIKVFESNNNGKIEFTRNELEKLLNEVYTKGYNVGYSEGTHKSWTWASPSINYRDINTISTSDRTVPISNLTCGSTDGTVATTTTSTSTSSSAPKITYGGGNDAIEAKSVAPNSITLQIKDLGEAPANINFAKTLDEVVNAIFNSSAKTEVETPHSKLAKELRGL